MWPSLLCLAATISRLVIPVPSLFKAGSLFILCDLIASAFLGNCLLHPIFTAVRVIPLHLSSFHPILSQVFSLLLNRVRSSQLFATAFNWFISSNCLQLTYLIWHFLIRAGPLFANFFLNIFWFWYPSKLAPVSVRKSFLVVPHLCPSPTDPQLQHFFCRRQRVHTLAGWCCARSATKHAVSLWQPRRHHPSNSGSHAIRWWCDWWRGEHIRASTAHRSL